MKITVYTWLLCAKRKLWVLSVKYQTLFLQSNARFQASSPISYRARALYQILGLSAHSQWNSGCEMVDFFLWCSHSDFHLGSNRAFYVSSFNLQLFFSYFKDLVEKEVTVELKNDLAIAGTLHSVDQYLNIKLENTRVVDQDKHPHMVLCSLSFVRLYSLCLIARYDHMISCF